MFFQTHSLKIPVFHGRLTSFTWRRVRNDKIVIWGLNVSFGHVIDVIFIGPHCPAWKHHWLVTADDTQATKSLKERNVKSMQRQLGVYWKSCRDCPSVQCSPVLLLLFWSLFPTESEANHQSERFHIGEILLRHAESRNLCWVVVVHKKACHVNGDVLDELGCTNIIFNNKWFFGKLRNTWRCLLLICIEQ